MTSTQRSQLVGSLYLLFGGALLCLIDFELSLRTSAARRSFDLLPDWLGMILFAIGLARLAAVHAAANFQRLLVIALSLVVVAIGCDVGTVIVQAKLLSDFCCHSNDGFFGRARRCHRTQRRMPRLGI